MNQTFDDIIISGAMPGGGSTYMNLSNNEKGELIFKDIKNSYVFWSIKKAIKEEIIRNKNTKMHEIAEMIPRLLKELNLETKIKSKVHEILDKNGYFRETS
jgi:transcription initiation factor TFIIIB Brf1 subunit/transcription initiation factor TFIIB